MPSKETFVSPKYHKSGGHMSFLGTKEDAKAAIASVEPYKDPGATATPSNALASGELSHKRTKLKPAHSGGVVRKME
jgi:hypothetical protein